MRYSLEAKNRLASSSGSTSYRSDQQPEEVPNDLEPDSHSVLCGLVRHAVCRRRKLGDVEGMVAMTLHKVHLQRIREAIRDGRQLRFHLARNGSSRFIAYAAKDKALPLVIATTDTTEALAMREAVFAAWEEEAKS